MVRNIIILVFLFSGVLEAKTVFLDDFTSRNSDGTDLIDLNANLSRQSGQLKEPVNYSWLNVTNTEGSAAGIEPNSDSFTPVDDVLLLRNATDAAGLTQCAVDLDHDFQSLLQGRSWTIRYDALITGNITDSLDNWLALGFGGGSGNVDVGGTGSDAFSFGIRSNGQWLLWYKDLEKNQCFINGGIEGFIPGQTFHVEMTVDDSGDTSRLDVVVTLHNGFEAKVIEGIAFLRSEAARFEFRLAAISGGVAAQAVEGHIDNLEIVTLKN